MEKVENKTGTVSLPPGRLMGLDYGTGSLGVAVSDATGRLATPLETIYRKRENALRKTLARLEDLLEDYRVTALVLGLPLHMDGGFSERAGACLDFGARLKERTGLRVFLQDERLTSVEAMERMREAGIKKSRYPSLIDQVAAQIILEDFLHSDQRNRREIGGEDLEG